MGSPWSAGLLAVLGQDLVTKEPRRERMMEGTRGRKGLAVSTKGLMLQVGKQWRSKVAVGRWGGQEIAKRST